MQRFYPLRWLAVALGLFGTQCLDSISDDCTKTLTCDDQPPPVLDQDCIWRYPGDPPTVWEGGPHYDRATERWRWPDGTETATQDFNCNINGIGDAGADAATGPDCRLDPTLCDAPRVCDDATGKCVECLSSTECSGNVPVGDAGAAKVCDLIRHECVQCTENENVCSGDTPVCKTDEANSDRNECVECVNDAQCGGATPVCDEATNECTARCTTPQECSGEKPVCNTTKQLCVECLDNTTCTGANATQCNTTSNECVECTNDAPCSASSEVCDTTSNNCVQCRDNVQCASLPGSPLCDTDTNLCVQCLNDQQCTDVASSRCNLVTHQCVGCQADAQCEGGLYPFCNQALGSCVACLEDANCTGAFNHICETTTGLCVECLNNAQCPTVDAARCIVEPEENKTQYSCDVCTDNAQCTGKSDGGLCRPDGLCVDCLTNAECSGNPALSNCVVIGEPNNGNTGECIVCAGDTDCLLVPGKLACKTGEGCVECVNDTHCVGNAGGTHCKVSDMGAAQGTADVNTCVECNSNADCTGAGAALCTNNQCVPCAVDNDCAHLDTNGATAGGTLPVCDSGTCVECTGPKRTACGLFVCESRNRVCSTTAQANSANLCDSCVSDQQCATNARCVQQTFGGTVIGDFCVPLPAGTPAACSRPYFGDLTTATLDSADPTAVCVLRQTTCPGLNEATAPCDQDADCGADGVADGLCVPVGGASACTTPCVSAFDCTGTAACTDGCEL
jgi:hypothetical protein